MSGENNTKPYLKIDFKAKMLRNSVWYNVLLLQKVNNFCFQDLSIFLIFKSNEGKILQKVPTPLLLYGWYLIIL